ncbi:alginate lyase family protein [Kribbella sp.]|uniref:alginate lyase family protein n=1 Tax=Kribbella sp. TaxID=1871183 RepID=UPI002D5D06FA|nr:alginate lyase family protein [Kribbella sp.]HZX08161.1 alginate lyase family protein [Kribbella sp.]
MLAAQPTTAAPPAFKHPGVLVDRAQLDFARQQVQQGAQPQKAAYDAMKASAYAALSYTPKPRAIVECGSSSNPNNGCSDERNDALAAYTQALMWYFTRDDRYAKKSTQIMDAWSAVLKDHTNTNAPLQTGWSGASFSRSGELIKYTYGGPWAQRGRFERMLRDVYLPEVRNGAGCKNGNWELIMTDAAKAPSTCPKSTRQEIVDYWQGQSTFTNGLAQETCRDFGHTGWGLTAATQIAETAYHQGVDLYAEAGHRLTDAYHLPHPPGERRRHPVEPLRRHREEGASARSPRLSTTTTTTASADRSPQSCSTPKPNAPPARTTSSPGKPSPTRTTHADEMGPRKLPRAHLRHLAGWEVTVQLSKS